MTEREMEDLLWNHPDKFFSEPLTQFLRQPVSGVGRADLVFKDRLGRLLIVELKKGKLERGAIDQLLDYFGMMKRQFPETPVELMVIASNIPAERQLACEKHDINCFVISEKKFHDVAGDVGYKITSELSRTQHSPSALSQTSVQQASRGAPFKIEKAWGHWTEKDGKGYYLAFVNAKGNCSVRMFNPDGLFLTREYGSGDYQNAFAERYTQARRLTLTHQPNLEQSCRTGLPDWVLTEFQGQLSASEATNVVNT
jgi:hypothetical protein